MFLACLVEFSLVTAAEVCLQPAGYSRAGCAAFALHWCVWKMVLVRTPDDGADRPATAYSAPGTQLATNVSTFLTEFDEEELLPPPGESVPRPDTAPHSRAGLPTTLEDSIELPPEVDVGDSNVAGVAQQLFPALAPKKGLAGRVGMLKLQGAIATVRDKRRRKRDEVQKSMHTTITNLTVNHHLARNGLLAHPSLRSHLPKPPEDGWNSARPLHGPNRKAPKPTPERVLEAADKFDERHKKNVEFAQRAYGLTLREPSSPRAEKAFERNSIEVRRNRYVLHEALSGTQTFQRRERKVSSWKLETSIWAPRKKYCEAKDFYDNEVGDARA